MQWNRYWGVCVVLIAAGSGCAHAEPAEELPTYTVLPVGQQKNGKRGPIKAVDTSSFATLSVNIPKSFCFVKVAGNFLGEVPVESASVPPGEHEVVVSCGKRNWIRDIRFRADEVKEINLTADHFKNKRRR